MAEGIDYNAEYSAVGDVGEFGEFEYFCTSQTDRISYPFPYRCASYMTCDATYGNPHHGATHFDNFGAAFLLIFQVYAWYWHCCASAVLSFASLVLAVTCAAGANPEHMVRV